MNICYILIVFIANDHNFENEFLFEAHNDNYNRTIIINIMKNEIKIKQQM